MNMREAAKDWISNLPDPIVHHILSFLSIKHVVRTSVLSKRWNYIWTTVPSLNLHSRDCDDLDSVDTQKFMDFVDGTLHRHASNVDKFYLHWDVELNDTRVHSWINSVIKGKVKKLRLYLCQKRPLFVPLSLFTCESLTSLELKTRPNIHLPKYISFPSLKRLELREYEFGNESWNEEIFSNSTVLEELILHRCGYHMKSFCISIATLKHLKIETSRYVPNGLRDCVFTIDAPKLVTFCYMGFVAKEFILSSFLALAEATVDCFTGVENEAVDISRLLCALAQVRRLTVYDLTLQGICSSYDMSNNLLTFHNVKKLKISDSVTSDEGLIALLKAMPNLECLVFVEYMYDEMVEDSDEDDENGSDEDSGGNVEGDEDDDNEENEIASIEGDNHDENEKEEDIADAGECRRNDDSEDDIWALDILSTGCLVPHLKSVCFHQFVGNPRGMKWMRLILRDAKALRIMTIGFHDSY